jgi:hypothetical protein
LEEFDDNSNVVILRCKHGFHYECIKTWIKKKLLSPNCPNCNTNIITDEKKIDDSQRDIVELVDHNININENSDHNQELRLNVNNDNLNNINVEDSQRIPLINLNQNNDASRRGSQVDVTEISIDSHNSQNDNLLNNNEIQNNNNPSSLLQNQNAPIVYHNNYI